MSEEKVKKKKKIDQVKDKRGKNYIMIITFKPWHNGKDSLFFKAKFSISLCTICHFINTLLYRNRKKNPHFISSPLIWFLNKEERT